MQSPLSLYWKRYKKFTEIQKFISAWQRANATEKLWQKLVDVTISQWRISLEWILIGSTEQQCSIHSYLNNPSTKFYQWAEPFWSKLFNLNGCLNYLQCHYSCVVSDVSTSTCRTFCRILRYKNEQWMKVNKNSKPYQNHTSSIIWTPPL
jgi:hypothetical protein